MNHLEGAAPPGSSSAIFVRLAKSRNGAMTMLARDIDLEQEVAAYQVRTRATVFALPKDDTGLDLERVSQFQKKMGASKKPILFMRPDIFDDALKIAAWGGPKEPSGIYFPSLNFSIVQRDPALEELNGPELTESFAIHESAHSTHTESPIRLLEERRRFLIGQRSVQVLGLVPKAHEATSSDLLLPDFGNQFEEGYAELERGLFVEQHNLTEQFAPSTAVNYDSIKRSPISLKYAHGIASPEAKGKKVLTIAPGALAASVFDILIKSNGDLLDNLRKSRHDDSGHREVAASIDNLVPGLYSELQRADNDSMINILGEVSKELD